MGNSHSQGYVESMIRLILIFLFAFSSPQIRAEGSPPACSPINYCKVEKKTFGKKGWSSDYVKEISLDRLCEGDRNHLPLEEALGLEFWVFSGKAGDVDRLKQMPHLELSLHTYKLTFVVASSTIPLSTEATSFYHRMTPKGKTLLEVNCFKK